MADWTKGGAMRIQTGLLISLGYGRYVRSDEVVAVEPITEGRGPGRRCLVYIRGVPDAFVSSRAQASIIADLMRPAEASRRGSEQPTRPRPRRPAQPNAAAAKKRAKAGRAPSGARGQGR
jgi:hypothetical protein